MVMRVEEMEEVMVEMEEMGVGIVWMEEVVWGQCLREAEGEKAITW